MGAINNGIPYINGRLYDWGQVKCVIGGVPVTGVRAISYDDTQDTAQVFAAGRYPVGVGKGRITATASITLLKDEIVALEAAAPGHRLQDIAPFDIVVTYNHPTLSKIVSDVIKHCIFTKNGDSLSEGDMHIEMELPLTVSHILFQQ